MGQLSLPLSSGCCRRPALGEPLCNGTGSRDAPQPHLPCPAAGVEGGSLLSLGKKCPLRKLDSGGVGRGALPAASGPFLRLLHAPCRVVFLLSGVQKQLQFLSRTTGPWFFPVPACSCSPLCGLCPVGAPTAAPSTDAVPDLPPGAWAALRRTEGQRTPPPSVPGAGAAFPPLRRESGLLSAGPQHVGLKVWLFSSQVGPG